MRIILFIFCYFGATGLCYGQTKFPYVDSFVVIPKTIKEEIVKRKAIQVFKLDSSVVTVQRYRGSLRATCFFEKSRSTLEIFFYIKRKKVEILSINEVCRIDSGHTYNRCFEIKNQN